MMALVLPQLAEGSLWVSSKCPGESCFGNPDAPILDWNGEKCVCRPHPCWFDQGVTHACHTKENPYLVFGYHANGTLSCGCQGFPHMGSVWVQQNLCPGEVCHDERAPVLDYDEQKKKCICMSNPCSNDNGVQHQCGDPRYPILSYGLNREGKLQCGCSAKLHHHEYHREL